MASKLFGLTPYLTSVAYAIDSIWVPDRCYSTSFASGSGQTHHPSVFANISGLHIPGQAHQQKQGDSQCYLNSGTCSYTNSLGTMFQYGESAMTRSGGTYGQTGFGGLDYRYRHRIGNYMFYFACRAGENWDVFDADGDGVNNGDEVANFGEWWNDQVTPEAENVCDTESPTITIGPTSDDLTTFGNSEIFHNGCVYNNPQSTEQIDDVYEGECNIHEYYLDTSIEHDSSRIDYNSGVFSPNSCVAANLSVNSSCNIAPGNYVIDSVEKEQDTYIQPCVGLNGTSCNADGGSIMISTAPNLTVGSTYSNTQICTALQASATTGGTLINSPEDLHSYTRTVGNTTVTYSGFKFLGVANQSTNPSEIALWVISYTQESEALDCSLPENSEHEDCQEPTGEGEGPINTGSGACEGAESGQWCDDVLQELKDINEGLNDTDGLTKALIPDDGLYTPSTNTVDSVLNDFITTVQSAPFYTAATGYFSITIVASCPIWSIPSFWVFNSIVIDMQCSAMLNDIWPFISAVFIMTCGFVGFRWAFL